MKLAHVGLGYWGPNLLRNWNNLGVLSAAFEIDINNLKKYATSPVYRDVFFDTNWELCLGRSDIDAVSIATPPHTHYDLAKAALLNDKHVYVEKPMTLKSEHAEELVKLAEERDLILMVGHTFLYSPEILKMKEIISGEDFGQLLYIYTNRLNLGKIQSPANVIEDLAPHDFSIFDFLTDAPCDKIQAFATNHILDSEDIAFVNAKYENGTTAHMHLSWLDPLKVRRLVAVGSKKMAVCDSLSENKIAVYDKGVDLQLVEDQASGDYSRHLLSYRYGDVLLRHIDVYEPLAEMCTAFVHSVADEAPPLSDGHSGVRVVRSLTAAQESMKKEGLWVKA